MTSPASAPCRDLRHCARPPPPARPRQGGSARGREGRLRRGAQVAQSLGLWALSLGFGTATRFGPQWGWSRLGSLEKASMADKRRPCMYQARRCRGLSSSPTRRSCVSARRLARGTEPLRLQLLRGGRTSCARHADDGPGGIPMAPEVRCLPPDPERATSRRAAEAENALILRLREAAAALGDEAWKRPTPCKGARVATSRDLATGGRRRARQGRLCRSIPVEG